jgi:hypothetical protein
MIQVNPVHLFVEIRPFLFTTMIQVNPVHFFVEIRPFLDNSMSEVSLVHSLICCAFKFYTHFFCVAKPSVDGDSVTCDGMVSRNNESRKGWRGEICHAMQTCPEVHITPCTRDTGRNVVLTTPTSCAALRMSWSISLSPLYACMLMSWDHDKFYAPITA